MSFDIHDNLENKPNILGELLEQPQLCMLLNPNLTRAQLGKLKEIFYIVHIEHEGKSRRAIVCGWFQQEHTPQPHIVDMWQVLAEEE